MEDTVLLLLIGVEADDDSSGVVVEAGLLPPENEDPLDCGIE